VKRELLCEKCGAASVVRHAKGYPGEYVKHVQGVLRLSRPAGDISINGETIPWVGSCVCDYCSAPIEKGAAAIARTMGIDGDYEPWESEYLTIAGGAS
jgi:hypothetical protein